MRKYLLIAGGAWLTVAALACGGSGDGEVVVVGPTRADVFEPCAFDEDCPDFTECHAIVIDYGDVIVEDAMCTMTCFDDLDCPTDGICLGASSGPPLCYQLCFDDFDCPDGFGCVEQVVDDSFEPTCIPL
jgi:hypothetical protein